MLGARAAPAPWLGLGGCNWRFIRDQAPGSARARRNHPTTRGNPHGHGLARRHNLSCQLLGGGATCRCLKHTAPASRLSGGMCQADLDGDEMGHALVAPQGGRSRGKRLKPGRGPMPGAHLFSMPCYREFDQALTRGVSRPSMMAAHGVPCARGASETSFTMFPNGSFIAWRRCATVPSDPLSGGERVRTEASPVHSRDGATKDTSMLPVLSTWTIRLPRFSGAHASYPASHSIQVSGSRSVATCKTFTHVRRRVPFACPA